MADSMSPATSHDAALPAAPAPATTAEVARRTPGVIAGARWFWWIAGLTFANAVCAATHADINFVLGLGFAQLAHAVFQANAGVAYAIDAFFVAGFFLLGQQAQRGHAWAFLLGAGVYLCDTLVTLKFGRYREPGDFLPLAFHAYVLWQVGRGFLNLDAATKAAGVR